MRIKALSFIAVVASMLAVPLHADVFHLKSGGQIEGQLLGETEAAYQVRSFVGEVELPKDEVARVEEKPSIFDEYDKRVADLADTADAHYALAQWSAKNELRREYFIHLRKAIEIDPNHAKARKELGYTKVGDVWVDSKKVVQSERERERAAERARARHEREEAKRTALIQNEWEREIRSITNQYLKSLQRERREKGGKRMASIDDPLALGPMFQVLTSTRPERARLQLVEALASFHNEEAHEYLVVVALEDENARIRARAREILQERASKDKQHIVDTLRNALYEGRELIEERAALFLADLEALRAGPDMVNALLGRAERTFTEPVEARPRYVAPGTGYIGIDVQPGFAGTVVVSGNVYRSGNAVYYDPWVDYGRVYYTRFQRYTREVTVYRSEVRQALKDLTGVDFGFDRQAWLNWFQENHPQLIAEDERDAEPEPSDDEPAFTPGAADEDKVDEDDPYREKREERLDDELQHEQEATDGDDGYD